MPKSKIVFVSKYGSFLDVARHIQREEGIETAGYITNKWWKHSLDGLVPKLNSIQEVIDFKPDAVLYDYVNMPDEWKALSTLFHTFYGNPEVTLLEEDRKYGLKVMQESGIAIPRTIIFKSMKEAIEFLGDKENKKERWVFKTDAVDLSNLTIVEDEPGTLSTSLERVIKNKQLPASSPCILQQFVEGVEIDVAAYVMKGKILKPLIFTIEHKKAFVDEMGAATGASSALCWADDKYHASRLCIEGILKLEAWLSKSNYTGGLALNSIVTTDRGWKDEKVYGIEWTVRPGINSDFLFHRLFSQGFGEFVINACKGQATEVPIRGSKVAMGLAFSMNPFPLELKDSELQMKVMEQTCKGTYLCDLNNKDIMENHHIFWGDAVAKDGEVLVGGTDGLFVYNAHRGDTIIECHQKAIKVADYFKHIPSLAYRKDGVPRAKKTIGALKNSKMLETVPQ